MSKIVWNQNPLLSYVELDDTSRELIRAKMQLALLDDAVYDVLAHNSAVSLDKLQHAAEYEPSNADLKEVESHLRDSHGGDCTGWSISCIKCYYEAMLNTTTISCIGFYELSLIASLYGAVSKIDDVIRLLSKPLETENPPDLTQIIMAEKQARAAAWLRLYKKEHKF